MIDESASPIFLQIKEKIKDDIMAGAYMPDELIISTTQIAKLYAVNPATAVKSVSILQDEGIVYKKRGIGMCVAAGAREAIIKERTAAFYDTVLKNAIREARKLNIGRDELIQIIREAKDYD